MKLNPLVSFERRFQELEKDMNKNPNDPNIREKLQKLWKEYNEYREKH